MIGRAVLEPTAARAAREAEEVEEARRERKRRRYDLRTGLWDMTSLDRCRSCGRLSINEDGAVGLRVSQTDDGRRAGFAGLTSCGSVWACPVCASKIAAHRGSDLAHVLNWAVEEGHTVLFLTMTARHKLGDDLAKVWDGVTGAWSALTAGAAWAGESLAAYERATTTWMDKRTLYGRQLQEAEAAIAAWEHDDPATRGRKPRRPRAPAESMRVRRVGLAERWGVIGWARAVEVTDSPTGGWHPHLHVVMVLEGQQSESCGDKLRDALWELWEPALEARGMTAVKESWNPRTKRVEDVAIRVDHVNAEDTGEIASYVLKSLSMEVTNGVNKTGHGESRAPFQILHDVLQAEAWEQCQDTGEVSDDLAKWWDWEHVSRGRKQLTWSVGLRELAGLAAEEMSDEDIAAEEVQDDNMEQLWLPADSWRQVRPIQVHLLLAAEADGLDGARRWLTDQGIPWDEHAPDRPPPASAATP